jgi:Astacin (Peptidase family M12A)
MNQARFSIKAITVLCIGFLTILLMAGQCGPVPEALKINSFTATPQTLASSGEITLAWDVKGTDEISIDQEIGVVTGSSRKVTVTKDTTFTLTASKGNQKTTATASVKVAVDATPATFIELPAPNPTAPAKTAKLPVDIEGDYAVYQGDILFPVELVQGASSSEITAQGNRMQDGYCYKKAVICWDRSYLWPNKTLSYSFDAGVGPALRGVVAQAAQKFFQRAGITLVENGGADRVLIKQLSPKDDRGGSSAIGRVEGVQEMFFQPDAPLATVLHEFGHALGLWHEQSRADRDNYIRLIKGNIKEDRVHNFELKDDPDMAHIDGPYDFASLMHYPANAFAKDESKPVFELVNPSSYDISKIGNATDLSPGDVLALANLYDTPVTDGSIRLVMKGSRTLVNGGSTTINVRIDNKGPRPMRDLYFAIQADKPVTLSGGNGLVCGASTGPAGNPIFCYVQVGPASGEFKDYGPITVGVPTDAPNGTITISLGVRPMGTRLADPAKGVSTVKLQQIRVEPDVYEVDDSFTQAKSIGLWENQNRTIHVASDVDYMQVSAPDASDTKAYSLSLEAENTAVPLSAEWFDENKNPITLTQYENNPNSFITKPGTYYVAVRGKVTHYQAQLSSINLAALGDLLRNLPYYILEFEWDGPDIFRKLVNEYDYLEVTGLAVVKLKSDNAIINVYDQFGEVYSQGGIGDGDVQTLNIPTIDPAGDPRHFFLKVERANNTVVEGDLVLEQPIVGYGVVGCTAERAETCPVPK